MTNEELIRKFVLDCLSLNIERLEKLKTSTQRSYCRGLINMAGTCGYLSPKELDEWTDKVKGVKLDEQY